MLLKYYKAIPKYNDDDGRWLFFFLNSMQHSSQTFVFLVQELLYWPVKREIFLLFSSLPML